MVAARWIGATVASGLAIGTLAAAGGGLGGDDPVPPHEVKNAVLASGAEQPIAIFHAFDQSYTDVTRFVCQVGSQGYSHVQIAPAQRSNPDGRWWARYQPIDYTVIDGRGTVDDLRTLVDTAHGCGVRIIADVVFNHMAAMPEFASLNFPGLSVVDFHKRCDINYSDGNRETEINCWLGDLPDLDQTKDEVRQLQEKHLDVLLGLGIDGFRFDAAKHIAPAVVQHYIDYVNQHSGGSTWNYLEVIEDSDTNAEDYNGIAAVEDFELYASMKAAFTFTGDLRTLRVPHAVADPRSVTFGRNHDNIREINTSAIDPYDDKTDSYLASAYVLAHESGTPLILNWDNADAAYLPAGARFRSIMRSRAATGANVKEVVLGVVDSATVLMLERGGEGWFVVNKAAAAFDVDRLDLTLTDLEGCYRELRNNFTVAVQRQGDGKKWITRWGTTAQGGIHLAARDALFLVRDPWQNCQ